MNKKPKSTILVICTILFLAIFIILPPVFRVMIPKEVKKKNVNNDSIILICDKEITEEGYAINSRIRYVGVKPQKNTITINKIVVSEQDGTDNLQPNDQNIPNNTLPNTTPDVSDNEKGIVASQLEFFKSISGIEITEREDSTTILIKSSIAKNNSDLLHYLQPIKKQQAYYENEGYMCSTMRL